MIDTNHRRQQRTTENDARSRRSSRASSPRRRHSASISDAVVAAYIHELRHAAARKNVPPRPVAATGDEGC